MKKIIYILLIFNMALLGCDDSLSGAVKLCDVEIVVEYPEDMPAGTTDSPIFKLKNISSGAEYTAPEGKMRVIPGLYDIVCEARHTTPDRRVFTIRAFMQSCVISEGPNTVNLTASYIIDTDDLIISEIFFAGTLLPSGNAYNGDDYVKLYNNTDHVVYADGITLFESKFTTTEKNSYTPDIMATAMTVQALYTIPGSGRDHPIAPGEYVILADNGIDHRLNNPESFDLSHADFEWYDVSSSASNLDIDSPTVPNLDKWYCYTKSYWMLHNRGYKAFGIARIPISKEEYLDDYFYSYDYETVTAASTFPMSGQAYRLPNEWIVDVVNCSVASNYAWNVCAAALDCGWTSCGTIANDKTRFSKSVRRKLLYIRPDGTVVLKDTNNSTEDFNASVKPSALEGANPTYDGIIPLR